MTRLTTAFKSYVTAVFVTFAFLPAVQAQSQAQSQSERLDQLFEDLAADQGNGWQTIEQQIWEEWSRSGSAAMDLLLERGREAMQAEDWVAAVEHLTALTDHAPDFAEGWNARATAYFHLGKFGPSVRDIQHVLALNPRHFGALSGLGMIMEQLGYEAEALEAYRAALAIHPHRPDLKDAVERLDKRVGGTDL